MRAAGGARVTHPHPYPTREYNFSGGEGLKFSSEDGGAIIIRSADLGKVARQAQISSLYISGVRTRASVYRCDEESMCDFNGEFSPVHPRKCPRRFYHRDAPPWCGSSPGRPGARPPDGILARLPGPGRCILVAVGADDDREPGGRTLLSAVREASPRLTWRRTHAWMHHCCACRARARARFSRR